MAIVDNIKFNEYTKAIENYAELSSAYNKIFNELRKNNEPLNKVQLGEIRNDERLSKIDLTLKDRLENECVISYVNDIVNHSKINEEYFSDIRQAAASDNLYLLMILIRVTEHLPLLNPAIDLFLLNYLSDYLEKPERNRGKTWFAKYLFEQVLDTANHNLNEYIIVIDKIFSMNKGQEWYKDFYDQVTKLIYLAPIKQETFFAVKKGLANTSNDVKSIIKDYLERNYITANLADKQYNWLYPSSL